MEVTSCYCLQPVHPRCLSAGKLYLVRFLLHVHFQVAGTRLGSRRAPITTSTPQPQVHLQGASIPKTRLLQCLLLVAPPPAVLIPLQSTATQFRKRNLRRRGRPRTPHSRTESSQTYFHKLEMGLYTPLSGHAPLYPRVATSGGQRGRWKASAKAHGSWQSSRCSDNGRYGLVLTTSCLDSPTASLLAIAGVKSENVSPESVISGTVVAPHCTKICMASDL